MQVTTEPMSHEPSAHNATTHPQSFRDTAAESGADTAAATLDEPFASGDGESSTTPDATLTTDEPKAGCCPVCGSTIYRRSRRRLLERLTKRPPMARCRECHGRFPLPRHRKTID